MSSVSILLLFLVCIIFEYLSDYLLNHQQTVSLETNKEARISTLCALYFAQGFPWGFMTIALAAYLNAKGISLAETGQLLAMAILPWTFKLLWAPFIDSFNYPAMGRRRPWIIFAQLMMAITLISMAISDDLITNLTYLSWMFFLHNCFASLQDVCTDALAVDILLPEERGKVNGFMWGSKTIGIGVGGAVMATLLANTSINFTVIFQTGLILLVMLFPLLIRERIGEKLLPWTEGKSMLKTSVDSIRNPIQVVKDIFKGFSLKTTFFVGIFLLCASIGDGINSTKILNFYTQTLGWSDVSYSQVSGGIGTIFEFFGAILGGFLADRIGRKKTIMMGFGGFGIIAIIFGFFLPDYSSSDNFLSAYLFLPPFFRALGLVAVFSLCMNISWTNSAATMFTCYMAISNISTTIGTKIAAPIDSIVSCPNHLFIVVGIVAIIPLLIISFISLDTN